MKLAEKLLGQEEAIPGLTIVLTKYQRGQQMMASLAEMHFLSETFRKHGLSQEVLCGFPGHSGILFKDPRHSGKNGLEAEMKLTIGNKDIREEMTYK